MLNNVEQNNLKYNIAASILRQLFAKAIITEDEMDEIDTLNRISYNQILIGSTANL